MSLLTKFNLALVVVFSLAMVPAGYISRAMLGESARTQVIQNARIMMETAMAVRGYTIKQIKPLLDHRLAEEFLPQTVPAYSATEIFNYLRETHPEYQYKEATLNPSNPRDRTVDWEADIVNEFRRDAKRTEIIGERDTPEGRSLFLSHPIQIKDARCLACHLTPEEAPPSVVKMYGPGNGFGWKLNEIIGAQIISVPMSIPIRMANEAFRTLLTSLVVVFRFHPRGPEPPAAVRGHPAPRPAFGDGRPGKPREHGGPGACYQGEGRGGSTGGFVQPYAHQPPEGAGDAGRGVTRN
jgi:protein-histidine pros-kinase